MNFSTSRDQSTPTAKRRRGLGYIAVGAAACLAGTTGLALGASGATSSPTSKNGVVPTDYGTQFHNGGNVTCEDLGYANDSSSGTGGYNWGGDNTAFSAHFASLGITVDAFLPIQFDN